MSESAMKLTFTVSSRQNSTDPESVRQKNQHIATILSGDLCSALALHFHYQSFLVGECHPPRPSASAFTETAQPRTELIHSGRKLVYLEEAGGIAGPCIEYYSVFKPITSY